MTAAGRLPGAPTGFAVRAHALLAHVGTTSDELTATVDGAQRLVRDVERAVAA